MSHSPLGRFTELAALVTALAVAGAWLLVQLGLIGSAVNTTALDIAAGTAIGILLGQRQATNSAGQAAASAHDRLDHIEAATRIPTHEPPATPAPGP